MPRRRRGQKYRSLIQDILLYSSICPAVGDACSAEKISRRKLAGTTSLQRHLLDIRVFRRVSGASHLLKIFDTSYEVWRDIWVQVW